MGFSSVDMGALSSAREIERIPHQLFPAWKTPVIVSSAIFTLFWIYSLFKYQICENIESSEPWQSSVFKNILMVNFNRTLAMTAITNLAATYFPGVLASYLQLYRGTKYRRFPQWLNSWMIMRKQLGLISLLMASLHAVISVTMSSPFYLTQAYEEPAILWAQFPDANSTAVHQVAVFNRYRQGRAEFGLTIGSMALCALVVVGITSLPSVGGTLTWREFMFVQSGIGWSALLAATLHNIMLGWDFMVLNYSCSTPSPLQIGMYLPTVTIVAKLPILFPPVAKHLAAIRTGFERKTKRSS